MRFWLLRWRRTRRGIDVLVDVRPPADEMTPEQAVEAATK
jgi:hypothetical protein